jgi:hypothetical protein
MWEDDDDNEDFDSEGYDPEEERRQLEALPVYKKAMVIFELTKQLIETFREDDMAAAYCELMMEDAMIIPAKIAGSQVDDYILKMENATVIKMHARSLLTKTSGARELGLTDMRYLQLLRDELEEFRLLFRDWVKSFESGVSKEPDGWGMFVPDEE